jgi:hypothetical protein
VLVQATSVLDSRYICCDSGMVDDCGVCDGDNSCSAKMGLTLYVDSSKVGVDLATDPEFMAALIKLISDNAPTGYPTSDVTINRAEVVIDSDVGVGPTRGIPVKVCPQIPCMGGRESAKEFR